MQNFTFDGKDDSAFYCCGNDFCESDAGDFGGKIINRESDSENL